MREGESACPLRWFSARVRVVQRLAMARPHPAILLPYEIKQEQAKIMKVWRESHQRAGCPPQRWTLPPKFGRKGRRS
jgi:hypothetical protein